MAVPEGTAEGIGMTLVVLILKIIGILLLCLLGLLVFLLLLTLYPYYTKKVRTCKGTYFVQIDEKQTLVCMVRTFIVQFV